jgi:hypothetical protein
MVLVALVSGLSSCRGDYDLAPTFCDDWCRATSRCGDPPSSCVSDCELSRASEACSDRQRELLECYEAADPGDFACVEQGFAEQTRVRGQTCQTERDSLFECEAPGIGVCLTACRQAQQELLSTTEPSRVDLFRSPNTVQFPDGGVMDCPVLDAPCEAQCWTLLLFASSALEGVGTPSAALFECAQEALLSCYPAAPAADSSRPPTLTVGLTGCLAAESD